VIDGKYSFRNKVVLPHDHENTFELKWRVSLSKDHISNVKIVSVVNPCYMQSEESV